jgi:hypothetical protein
MPGIPVSNNWENNLTCPVELRLSLTPIFGTTAASMGWLVARSDSNLGPTDFESEVRQLSKCR